jgi:hypothetical protein
MTNGIQIGPNVVQFEDPFIEIRILAFSPFTGLGDLVVEKRQPNVGFYYINISFASGDSVRLDYDGANLNNPDTWELRSSHRNDTIVRVWATKVR